MLKTILYKKLQHFLGEISHFVTKNDYEKSLTKKTSLCTAYHVYIIQ